MRRLAQEIITDQQLENELMQRWLKQQHANRDANNPLVLAPLPIDTGDSATSAMGKKGHGNLRSRPRLHGRSNFKHGLSNIPAENKLLGVIRLGDPVPGALSPLTKGSFLSMDSDTRPILRRWL